MTVIEIELTKKALLDAVAALKEGETLQLATIPAGATILDVDPSYDGQPSPPIEVSADCA